MKTSELRIGNYFNVSNPTQSPFRIDGFEFLDANDCKVFKNNVTYDAGQLGQIPHHPLTWYFKDLVPIELTLELLLSIGFSDKDYKQGFIGIDFKGGNVILDFVLEKPYSKGEWNDCFTFNLQGHRFINIKYLHQLQNFYFIMTGSELEFELIS